MHVHSSGRPTIQGCMYAYSVTHMHARTHRQRTATGRHLRAPTCAQTCTHAHTRALPHTRTPAHVSHTDDYQKCRSEHCHLLILSCPSCRARAQRLHHCCDVCFEQDERARELSSKAAQGGRDHIKAWQPREQCICVDAHARIPVDTIAAAMP